MVRGRTLNRWQPRPLGWSFEFNGIEKNLDLLELFEVTKMFQSRAAALARGARPRLGSMVAS
jgi:hypothetical protein